jgi:3-polyprenyl-4-hydroxybenzoate decarboxylase
MDLAPRRIIESDKVQENVLQGDDINLYQFPLPRHHELDGGRYCGRRRSGAFPGEHHGGTGWGVEDEFAGGLKGEPIEVIEGPYRQLSIPAHAKNRDRGRMPARCDQAEGRFGERAGWLRQLRTQFRSGAGG